MKKNEFAVKVSKTLHAACETYAGRLPLKLRSPRFVRDCSRIGITLIDKNNQNGLCAPYLAALLPDAAINQAALDAKSSLPAELLTPADALNRPAFSECTA